MLVAAMVGVSLGLAISLDRAFASKHHGTLVSSLICFWGTYIFLAWPRKKAVDSERGG
jgi:hypothetical protein